MKLLTLILSLMIVTPAFSYLLEPPVQGSLCTTSHADFDGFRYAENIPHCKRNVSTRRKKAICKRDGVLNRKDYTVDHIVPLSVGGDNSNDNLWCQHQSINVTKLEYTTYVQLRDGKLVQREALEILRDAKFR